MSNAPERPPPQPSPPPSVSDFVKKVSTKIDQLQSESSVARPLRDAGRRPKEFSSTLHDFIGGVRRGEETEERQVPAASPAGCSVAPGPDPQHHADGREQDPHSSSNRTQPAVSGTQPLVGEIHPAQDSQASGSIIQASMDQSLPSASGRVQSCGAAPATGSASQVSAPHHGSDGTRRREKRYRDESADEESEVEGSRGGKRRRKSRSTSRHHVVEVPISERYQECLGMVAAAGEQYLARLRSFGLLGRQHGFASLQPDHTRALLNQTVQTRRERRGAGGGHYKDLLALHGLIKAADLLRHCGLDAALHCLNYFLRTHHVLLTGCHTEVVARLSAVRERGGEGAVHPKVAALRQEMQRARQRGDPSDTEFKVLVAVRREAQWVCRQLEEEFGSENVALLSRLPEYHHVLHLLEQRSVVVWEEGEALHQLPCSQFSLVVEWEGSTSSSVCVDHCTRQNIHVVTFIIPSPCVGEQECSSKEESRDQPESKGGTSGISTTSKDKSIAEVKSSKSDGGKRDSFTIVASSTVTANNELHYILTSTFDINLVERNARDVLIEEARQGWADLLLDERTCVLLRPLASLSSDANLSEVTCQLVLLSLQCTTCYVLLYAQHSYSSGYEFRSRVLRAMTRLTAACLLLSSPEYTVSLLLAYNLHQHERVLLSLPCINSIAAQVILTAMSLRQVLQCSLPQMTKTLPWIPSKVVKMLYKFVHGEQVSDIMVGRYSLENTHELSTKEGSVSHRSKALEDAAQNGREDPHFQSHTDCKPENTDDSKTAFFPMEGNNINEATRCCVEEERLVPPVPPHFLPDKVSLFTANNEAVSINPYISVHPASIPSKELLQTSNTPHPETLVPAATSSNYGSASLSESNLSLPALGDLHPVLNTDSKHLTDLFDPYKYLQVMEQNKRTDMPPQQYQQTHHHLQLPPPPQSLQSSQQYQHPPQSQQFLQEQGNHEAGRGEDIVTVSPFFPNLHNPLVTAGTSVTTPHQYYHHNTSQLTDHPAHHHHFPLTSPTEFFPQTWSETFRPSASELPNSNVPNVLYHQQGYPSCQQQQCSNKVFVYPTASFP